MQPVTGYAHNGQAIPVEHHFALGELPPLLIVKLGIAHQVMDEVRVVLVGIWMCTLI